MKGIYIVTDDRDMCHILENNGYTRLKNVDGKYYFLNNSSMKFSTEQRHKLVFTDIAFY
jgi:hypothetical protein